MTCPELNIPASKLDRLNLENYSTLHYDGQKLIKSWFDRSWESHDSLNGDDFEALIFLWISFNGWASCTTGLDKDFQIINALAGSERMKSDFDDILARNGSNLRNIVEGFSALLPIFDAKSLKRKHNLVHAINNHNRTELILRYIDQGATEFEPKCWMRHRDSGEPLPLDWVHVLKAIYKIRCNLFHGHKAAHSEMDRRIVSTAFLTLFTFMSEAGYLERRVWT